MASIQTIVLTRRQIYDVIWELSVVGMAKKYDVSYGQLMKQIKAAQIPVPPSGYWTQLSFGKPVTKPELSEPFDELVTILSARNTLRKEKVVPKLQRPEADDAELSMKDNNNKEKFIPTPPAVVPDTEDKTEEIVEPGTVTEYGQKYNIYNRETLYKE